MSTPNNLRSIFSSIKHSSSSGWSSTPDIKRNIIKKQYYATSPHETKNEIETTEFDSDDISSREINKLKRFNSEPFLHSWEYSNQPFSSRSKKRRKTKKPIIIAVSYPTPKRKSKNRSHRVRKVEIPEIKVSDEIAARTRSRRKTVEGRSKLYHEPEEMEIRDIDDEDEHSHVSQPAITVSPVTPRRARSPSTVTREHSRKALSRSYLEKNRKNDTTELERMWQESFSNKSFFNETQSITYQVSVTGKKEVSSGLLVQLINELVNQDNQFVNDFLRTHLYFMTTEELIRAIFSRYVCELDSTGTSQAAIEKIKSRLLSVIKLCIDDYFYLFNSTLVKILYDLTSTWILPRQPIVGERLISCIYEKVEGQELNYVELNGRLKKIHYLADVVVRLSKRLNPLASDAHSSKHLPISLANMIACITLATGCTDIVAANCAQKLIKAKCYSPASCPLVIDLDSSQSQFYVYSVDHSNQPKTIRSYWTLPKDILEISPTEFGRQLTLTEFDLFCSIKPYRDLVSSCEVKQPPVLDCVNFSNKLSNWVTATVVQTPNSKKRVAVIQWFVELVTSCWAMNNYSSAVSILHGLDHHSVQRLKLTWKSLPKKSLKQVNDLMDQISVLNNFEKLRAVQSNSTPPMIPYLPLYLKDISLIELGNPTFLGDSDTINFTKFRMISKRFSEIEALQRIPYNYRYNYVLLEWFSSLPSLPDEKIFMYSDLCEERNMTCELGKSKSSLLPVIRRISTI